MLCVWWHFEGAVIAAALYSEQLDHIYAALAARYPAAVINGKHALLQHNNVPKYIAALTKAIIKELFGIKFFPHPTYSLDLDPSSD